VQLNLIHRRHDLRDGQQFVEVRPQVIADTDRFHAT
jgi:hypothetical protein